MKSMNIRARVLALVPMLSLGLATLGSFGCGARTDISWADPEGLSCQPGTFTLKRANPALLFVIDRSFSMAEPVQGTNFTRWSALSHALSVSLPAVDDTMEIGALLFPNGVDNTNTNCSVATGPQLLPALHQVSKLLELVEARKPVGSTPTAQAITVAAQALQGIRAAQSARALVLTTDGGPDCNSALDASTCTCVQGGGTCSPSRCLDDVRTTSRVAEAAARGIPTYVIGIHDGASSVASGVLDALAVAGGRPQLTTAHRYYAATSETELTAALVSIRDQVGACTFLTSSVPKQESASAMDSADSISVSINGVEVPFDPSGQIGWNWVDRKNGELVLAQDACVTAHGFAARIEAKLTCSK